MRKFKGLTAILVSVLILEPAVFGASYTIDTDHTTVGFKVRHILSYVQGQFREFEGSFEYDPEKPGTWKADTVIQTASIDTNVEPRDKHLRSADFFDAAAYPTVTFKSTGVTDATAASAKLNGLLTIHGVEKPVALDLQIHGVAKDPWGNTRASFTASTTINRKDFGMTWSKVLETGQLLVGEEVIITLEVEGLLQEEVAEQQQEGGTK
mgnify:CR=1 FL=1